MTSDRKISITVGVLYIVATLAGVLSVITLGSLFQGSNMLADIVDSKNQMIVVALLNLIMATAVAGVAFMIYPVLKRNAATLTQEGLALWYVGTRITESVLFLVGVLTLLSLLVLSQQLVLVVDQDVSTLHALGSVMVDTSNYAWMLGQSIFCLGALMLYYLLYKSKIIPRWLSVWGFIAAPMMLGAGFLLLIDGNPNSPLSTTLYVPMALQEMVLAIWLIVKGFNSSNKYTKAVK